MGKPVSIKHVSWRDGRPRFSPGAQLRAAGHKGRDLRHADGSWFSRGEAVDWSDRFCRELAAAAKAKARPKGVVRPAAPAAAPYTVGRLFEEWRRSAKWLEPANPVEARKQRAARAIYAKNTLRDFKQRIGVIETFDPDLWAAPVDALTTPILLGWYEALRQQRGLSNARGAVAVFSIALAWGRRRGRFTFKRNEGQNPARDLGMTLPPPRVRFATRAEITALVAAADELGWPEMGDMVVLGVWTGQRQADRLQLVDRGLLNKRRVFRQNKTGAIVAVREAPELRARLAASAERRRKKEIVNPRVILNEQTWAPFPDDGDYYRKRFAELRAIAAKGIAGTSGGWKVKPCPSLLGDEETGAQAFIEADLRDTAVTWMALAGATVPEIVSVTGHTVQSATRILKHYLAQHPEMADEAIGKMVAWYEADGETEIGL